MITFGSNDSSVLVSPTQVYSVRTLRPMPVGPIGVPIDPIDEIDGGVLLVA